MIPYSVTFGGISGRYASWKQASFVVIPFPVDMTTITHGGLRHGPRAILDASANMELFDEENKIETFRSGIFVSNEIPATTSGQLALKEVERRVKATSRAGKTPVLLGGEHSGSIAAISALKKKYDQLTVLQFDAHTDLRSEYMGSTCNHACVGRRIVEQGVKLVQVGVRSMSEEEDRFLKKTEEVKTFFASEVRYNSVEVIKGIVSSLSGNLYITIDLDVFDPAVMPSVVTPEPGGLNWFEVTDILRDVIQSGVNLVGFDVMELSPIAGMTAPDYLAARLCYRMMGWIVAQREEGK